jgi:hypothetical protein
VDSSTPRPLLACAEQAGRDFLAGKVAEGVITEVAADTLYSLGFELVIRTIADLRRGGMSEQDITNWFARETADARATGRRLRLVIAQLYEAVWDGMQQDRARFKASRPDSS